MKLNQKEMFYMSGMKDLLGDMTLEEFEVMRKTVLEQIEKLYDSNDVEISSDARKLYDYWLELQGKEYAQKWVKYNGSNGHINHEQVNVLITEMFNKFEKWLDEVI
jgi:transketolase